jgi:hypothetical protein
MMREVRRLLSYLTISLMFISCASQEKEAPVDKRVAKAETQPPATQSVPAEETESGEKSKSLKAKQAPAQEEAKTAKSFVMSEAEKEQTRKDLNELVDELNAIIASRDYQRWLDYLTSEYKEHYSDTDTLQEISKSPILSKYGVKLRSLRDYFRYVVVASRKDVHISDIKAIGEDTVKAYMDVDGQQVVVYTLQKVGGRWKITISQ